MKHIVCIAVFVVVACVSWPAFGTNYSLVGLPSLGGDISYPSSINGSNQVVGTSYLPGNTAYHGCLWVTGAPPVDLGTLPGCNQSHANSINDFGKIVGESSSDDPLHPVEPLAVRWDPSTGISDIQNLFVETSSAIQINNADQIAGTMKLMPIVHRLFYCSDTSSGMLGIGTFGGTNAFLAGYRISATSMNALGAIVGTAEELDGSYHGFIWSPTNGFIDLSSLGGDSAATAVNDLNQIAGMSVTSFGETHAVVWAAGNTNGTDVGTLGGSYSKALAINNLGYVVGESTTASGTTNAFLWTPKHGMVDLDATGSGNTMSTAYLINNPGTIAGWLVTSNGDQHAFVWNPGSGMQDIGTMAGLSARSSIADLNDAGVICGDSWDSLGLTDQAFVWIPPNPTLEIANLINTVVSMNLRKGIENSLDAKLDTAANALSDLNINNNGAAVNALNAFIADVQDQIGTTLTQDEANTLIAAANQIIIDIQ